MVGKSVLRKCKNSPVLCLLQNINITIVDWRAQLEPKLAVLCEKGARVQFCVGATRNFRIWTVMALS